MRVDPARLAVARDRTRLAQIGLGTDVPHRVRARMMKKHAPAAALALLPTALLHVVADQARQNRVLRRAAAALHGPEIAAAVTPQARQALHAVIDAETRAFAVRHRGAGRSGVALAAAFDDSLRAVGTALAARLPAFVARGLDLPSGPVDPAAARCLDLALQEEVRAS